MSEFEGVDHFISVEGAANYILRQGKSLADSSVIAKELEEVKGGDIRSDDYRKKYFKLMRSMYSGGAISFDEYLFFVDFSVEQVVMDSLIEGKYPELSEIDRQLESIKIECNFDESSQDWPGGNEPIAYDELSKEFGERYEFRYREALSQAEASDLAKIRLESPEYYEASRERGRRSFIEPHKRVEALEELVLTYEYEAKKCAESKAYLSAIVMLGSAAECRILIKACKNDDEAKSAFLEVSRMSSRKLKKSKFDWDFDTLVKIATKAGWLHGLETQSSDGTTHGLAKLIRMHRNSVHPARAIKNRSFASIGCHDFQQVQAGYVLLRQALTKNTA